MTSLMHVPPSLPDALEVDSMKTGGGAVGVGKAPLGTCSVCSLNRVLVDSELKRK